MTTNPKFSQALTRLRTNEQTLEKQASDAASKLQAARERRESVEAQHKKLCDARDQDAHRLRSRKENAATLQARLAKAEAELARFTSKPSLGGFGRTEEVSTRVVSLRAAIEANASKIVAVERELAASTAAVAEFESGNSE